MRPDNRQTAGLFWGFATFIVVPIAGVASLLWVLGLWG
jgi:hypothetical protein